MTGIGHKSIKIFVIGILIWAVINTLIYASKLDQKVIGDVIGFSISGLCVIWNCYLLSAIRQKELEIVAREI